MKTKDKRKEIVWRSIESYVKGTRKNSTISLEFVELRGENVKRIRREEKEVVSTFASRTMLVKRFYGREEERSRVVVASNPIDRSLQADRRHQEIRQTLARRSSRHLPPSPPPPPPPLILLLVVPSCPFRKRPAVNVVENASAGLLRRNGERRDETKRRDEMRGEEMRGEERTGEKRSGGEEGWEEVKRRGVAERFDWKRKDFFLPCSTIRSDVIES